MKTLFLECTMGASGDMLMAALLELHNNPTDFICRLNALGIPGVKVGVEKSSKCGIVGTHVSVSIHGIEEESVDYKHDHDHAHNQDHEHKCNHEHKHHHEHNHDHEHKCNHEHNHDHEHSHNHDHEHNHEHEHNHKQTHSHNGLHEIEHIIENLAVSVKVKGNVLAVYSLIAKAESHAHGVPISEVHFHEVGSMDAVADITAVCMLIEELSPSYNKVLELSDIVWDNKPVLYEDIPFSPLGSFPVFETGSLTLAAVYE